MSPFLDVPSTATSTNLKTYTRAEVAKHNTEDSLWIIVDTAVFDITEFIDMHPGGGGIFLDPTVAGKDNTEAFMGLHRGEVLVKYGRYIIGTIENEKPVYILPTPGVLSPIPYAEPSWLTPGFKSPYYNDSHRALQKYMRKFADEVVIPEAQEHEKTGERPSAELIKHMGDINMHAMRLGPGKHLHGLILPGGLKGEDFDYFHELIITQELVRGGSARGYADGLQGGMVIGLPPVMNYANDKLKAEVMPAVLRGEKFISLAISEAFAGSDVANIKTTAVLTPDGKHFIVNGSKKWITNGCFADYFSVGCATKNGLSMLLIPRSDAVETKPIKTLYASSAGTAYVTFTDCKVPVENLLGREGKGIYVILSNFNHERLVMAAASCRSSRFIAEELMKWAHLRNVFGKPLIEQPVIRSKLASMFAKLESSQSQLEYITYQMCHMNHAQQAEHLAGPIGLLKMQVTRIAGDIATDAVQIFGGRGITAGGMGGHVSHFAKTQPFDAILGGAEDVLADLGVRQAMRGMPKAAL